MLPRPMPLRRSNRRIYDVYPSHETWDDLILWGSCITAFVICTFLLVSLKYTVIHRDEVIKVVLSN